MNAEEKQPIQPIEPIEASVAEMLTKVHELHPDRRYVFWFECAINPQYIQIIRRNLSNLGIVFTVISGIKEPKIYEFKESEDGKQSAIESGGESKS
jgi:hypothetical protein